MCVVFALVLVALAGFIFAIAVLAWHGAGELVYPPHRRACQTPADFGLAHEIISFRTNDGLTLRGWFIPAPDSNRALILCHGYSGDCSPDLDYAPLLHAAGYHLLFFDFRGHGASDGNYTSLVYFERDDVLAALAFLRSRGVTRAGLLGFSMGGAVALAAAPLSPMVVGVISDCTFAELWHVTRQAARRRGLPEPVASVVGWLVVLLASVRLRANLCSADPVRWIGKIAPRPVLIMHGAADADAPVAEAHQLYRAARAPKELWIVPGAAHRQIEQVAREEYPKRVVEFFDRAFENQ
ncbi:MAG: alpha/beta fold hydrolase [Chloroflexota bacterium]